MMDWNGNMTAGGWILSLLGLIILIALAVFAITWLVGELPRRRDRESVTSANPREILDRRLASGELKPEQYEQMRRVLATTPGRGVGPPPT